jgi:hypothetical protein
LARRVEDVDLQAGLVSRPGPVRHVGRDHHGVAAAQRARLAAHLELDLAVDHEGDLFLVVMMDRRFGVGVEVHDAHHHVA